MYFELSTLSSCRYGLSWNVSRKGHLLSASDDYVSTRVMNLIISNVYDFLDYLSMGYIWYYQGNVVTDVIVLLHCLLLIRISEH